MSRQQDLIQRNARRERKRFIVGTVLQDLELLAFDATVNGGETWVAPLVDIGSNRPLANVPVKRLDNGRLYAGRNQSVLLQLNAQGRYQIVGPADRVGALAVRNSNDFNASTQTAQGNSGFQSVPEPYEFYMGPTAMLGNPDLTFTANTITRNVGSFTADGLANGDSLVINSPLNDTTLTVTTVTALVLTFPGTPFTVEGPVKGSIGVAGSSRYNDGLFPYPLVRVLNGQGTQIFP